MNLGHKLQKNDVKESDLLEVSVVMPCLNEEETISACIRKAQQALRENNIKGEIVVVDNGSSDRSPEIALDLGARLLFQKEKGYGYAYQLGIREAKGRYIIIGDSDDTYDFSSLMKFVVPLRGGYEFVNGSRIKGNIHRGAMSALHRYIGNPLLSFILNLFFGSGFSDVYCGMKAFTKEAYKKISPISVGMEFALELIVNAARVNLKMTEVPVDLFPRKGKSKLRTFKDGWRSLRFMLLYCPNYLFIIPGSLIFVMGLLGMFLLLPGPVKFLNHTFDFHAMIFANILTLLGFQIINLGLFAKTYSFVEGFEKENSFFANFYRIFNLEKGIIAGGILTSIGLFMSLFIIREWLIYGQVIRQRQELFAFTLIILGIQIIFSSFLISLIGMKTKRL